MLEAQVPIQQLVVHLVSQVLSVESNPDPLQREQFSVKKVKNEEVSVKL